MCSTYSPRLFYFFWKRKIAVNSTWRGDLLTIMLSFRPRAFPNWFNVTICLVIFFREPKKQALRQTDISSICSIYTANRLKSVLACGTVLVFLLEIGIPDYWTTGKPIWSVFKYRSETKTWLKRLIHAQAETIEHASTGHWKSGC